MRKFLFMTAVALAGVTAFSLQPALAKKAATPIATLDTDNDGTVDLKEIDASAEALFDKMEKDADGTIDRKEISGRVSRKEFTAADPDKDGTLTKEEYLGKVAEMFKDADPDNDGTLDADELKSKKGKALLRAVR